KAFGTDFSFDGTEFSASGLVTANGDTVDGVTLTSDGAAAEADAANSPYAITGSNATGTGIGNYTITFVDGALTVTSAAPDDPTITEPDSLPPPPPPVVIPGADTVIDLPVFREVLVASNSADNGATPTATAVASSTSSAGGTESEVLSASSSATGGGTEQDAGTVAARPSSGTEGGTEPLSAGGGVRDSDSASASQSSDLEQAEETLAVVTEMSTEFELRADSCSGTQENVTEYLACLADALEDFSDELTQIVEDLPPGLESVAEIVRTASRDIANANEIARQRLGEATSDAEREAIRREALNAATASIQTAQEEIRKTIELVRAEDPELARLQRAQGETVLVAVATVETGLSRATGL
ncbi:MAG: MBG domain-containing protein, partial [Pseudomonadota bacterium]